MKVPANTQTGKKMRLKGLGLPSGGDQYVQLKIVNPEVSSDKDKAAFESFSKQFNFNPRKTVVGA